MAAYLRTAYPQIFVSDMERSVAFYEDLLGFRTVYLHGDPPFYGLVQRDGAGLNLRHADDPIVSPDRRAAEEWLAAAIPTSDLGALHAEYLARDVPMARGLTRQPWGEDFVIRDPDGNLICFGSATA